MFKLFLQKYLELSLRIGAYASTLYFNKIILSPFLGNLKSVISLVFGIISFELVSFLAKRWYKAPAPELEITQEDLEYRIRNEKIILEITIFYVLYVVLSSIVLYFYGQGLINTLGLGILGGVLQFFNFLGILPAAVIAEKEASHIVVNRIGVTLLSLLFFTPQIIYIILTFKIFF